MVRKTIPFCIQESSPCFPAVKPYAATFLLLDNDFVNIERKRKLLDRELEKCLIKSSTPRKCLAFIIYVLSFNVTAAFKSESQSTMGLSTLTVELFSSSTQQAFKKGEIESFPFCACRLEPISSPFVSQFLHLRYSILLSNFYGR